MSFLPFLSSSLIIESCCVLKRMTDYAYHRRCRRKFLLRYFGEADVPESCGHCDVCSGARLSLPAPVQESGRSARSTRRSVQPAPPAPPGEYSELAASELRRWRRELSKDLQVPAFIIFNDRRFTYRQIDGAKEQLALEQRLPVDASVEPHQITPYLPREKLPACP